MILCLLEMNLQVILHISQLIIYLDNTTTYQGPISLHHPHHHLLLQVIIVIRDHHAFSEHHFSCGRTGKGVRIDWKNMLLERVRVRDEYGRVVEMMDVEMRAVDSQTMHFLSGQTHCSPIQGQLIPKSCD